jgi:hypothetical protein
VLIDALAEQTHSLRSRMADAAAGIDANFDADKLHALADDCSALRALLEEHRGADAAQAGAGMTPSDAEQGSGRLVPLDGGDAVCGVRPRGAFAG